MKRKLDVNLHCMRLPTRTTAQSLLLTSRQSAAEQLLIGYLPVPSSCARLALAFVAGWRSVRRLCRLIARRCEGRLADCLAIKSVYRLTKTKTVSWLY